MNLSKISLFRPRFSFRFFVFFCFFLILTILLIEGIYYSSLKIIPHLTEGYEFDWRSLSLVAPREKIIKREGIFTYVEYPVGEGQREVLEIIEGVVEEVGGESLVIIVNGKEEIKIKYKDVNREIWVVTEGVGVDMGRFNQILPGDRVELSGISRGNGSDLIAEYLVVEK